MKAVILAGGLGKRLKPFTQVIPKSLLPIGESSVLEIQINRLIYYGVTEIFIATNYKSKLVQAFLEDGKKFNIPIKFSAEVKPLGTCGPITLLKEHLNEPFLLMNGDILSTIDYKKVYDFSTKLNADLVIVTKKIITPFQFGNVISKGDYIIGVDEKPDLELEILSGIYILKPPVFDIVPTNVMYGIDNLIKDMLKNNQKVAKYLMKDYWLDIGRIEDYEKAQTDYKEHFL